MSKLKADGKAKAYGFFGGPHKSTKDVEYIWLDRAEALIAAERERAEQAENACRKLITEHTARQRERETARAERDHSRAQFASASALIEKIQQIVHEAEGDPNERWSDLDVLDKGVDRILRRAEMAERARDEALAESDEASLRAVVAQTRANAAIAQWRHIRAELAEARDRADKAERERDEARQAIEADRSKIAAAVTALQKELDSRHWLTEGRGPYEWSDDRYQQEFLAAGQALIAAMKPLKRIAADLSNSPQTQDEVLRARSLSNQIDEARAELAEARERIATLQDALESAGEILGAGTCECAENQCQGCRYEITEAGRIVRDALINELAPTAEEQR